MREYSKSNHGLLVQYRAPSSFIACFSHCFLGFDPPIHSIAHLHELFINSKDPPPSFVLAVYIPVLVERGQPRFVRIVS